MRNRSTPATEERREALGRSLLRAGPEGEPSPDAVFLSGFRQTADPAGASILRAMATEHVVHLCHQGNGQVEIVRVARATLERQPVADCVGIGPEISTWRAIADNAAVAGEGIHQSACLLGACIDHRVDSAWGHR